MHLAMANLFDNMTMNGDYLEAVCAKAICEELRRS